IVRELQSVIGREAREQLLAVEGRLPQVVVACVGGGSNAIGVFAGFLDDAEVRLLGVEAAEAASLGTGRSGVLHGARSSLLAEEVILVCLSGRGDKDLAEVLGQSSEGRSGQVGDPIPNPHPPTG